MKENLELLQTLMALICHDLAGSIGAIDNCLGLMDTKDESISGRAKSLAKEESDNLIRKIQIFRECYSVSNCKHEINVLNLNQTLKSFFENSNIQLTLHFDDEILLDPMFAKTIMCLVMLTQESSKTEKIDLFFSSDNTTKIIASGEGLRLKKDNFWDYNNKARVPITLSNVREHYINMMCDSVGYNITAVEKKHSIEYTLAKTQ